MNQRNNQRFQETDRHIRAYFLQALEKKEIAKITVREICEAVGINRSSFYLHYPDVYALLEAVCTEVGKELFEGFDEAARHTQNYFDSEYLITLLYHVRKHHMLYRAYIEHVGMKTIDRGYDALFETVFKPWFRSMGIVSERRMIYHFVFVKTGFFSVLGKWLEYECAEPPEEMAQIILQSLAPIPEGLPVLPGLKKQA